MLKFLDYLPEPVRDLFTWIGQQEIWVIGIMVLGGIIAVAMLFALLRSALKWMFAPRRPSRKSARNMESRMAEQAKKKKVAVEPKETPSTIKLAGEDSEEEPVSVDSIEDAVELIEKLGGRLGKSKTGQVVMIFLNGTKTSNGHLVAIPYFAKTESLHLRRTKINDDGLVHLEAMSKLRFLYLTDTKVTDEAIENLKKIMPQLKIER